MNERIEALILKYEYIENKGTLWDIIKMEIRSSTICFSKQNAAKNRDNIKETLIQHDRIEKEMATNPSEELLKEYELTKSEIEYYNNEKANGALIRSKADWAEFGEKNSKYFLNLEKRNYKNKCITKLINESDEIIEDSNEILKYEEEFYKHLYTQPEEQDNIRNNTMLEFVDEETPKIQMADMELCEQNINLEEIGQALMDLKNGKSPGTDGFTPDFYKFFWTKIKLLVLNSLKHAYESGELSIEQKRGIINLIPKKEKDVRFLKNWRPISLLNTDYKILTKTLASRLKQVLPNVINEDQVAYLKDRFIGQNIRTIFDIMEFTKSQNKTGIIAFLDFEKAFDTIRWDVIEDTLKIFGLGENFVKWVKAIYKGSEACVTNNGFSCPFFKISRGVRQGCPLSAYLFIMVVELLANKIRKSKDIKGIKIDQTEIKILQMADDTTILVEDIASLKEVLRLISLFHIFAGLKLNKSKTKALWIGNWRNSKNTPLGLTWVNEIHSLGIFFSYNTDYVVQKNFTDKAKIFKKVLDLWSQRDLSLIGKITILKSLAFSTLTYQCCSILPPDNFIDDITTMAYQFLWNGKINKVKRKTIIADYGDGGLKMLDFKSFISAQKAMWVKRITKEGKASWKAYPLFILNKLIGPNSFNCNLDTKKDWHIKDFYWSIIKNWIMLNEKTDTDMDAMDIRRQCIWLNKHIKVNRQEIKWQTWIQNGIFLIHDIVTKEGKFMSLEEMVERHNFRGQVLQYNSLKDSIPKEWRERLKTMKVPRDAINIQEGLYMNIEKHDLPLKYITNRQVYWKIVKTIQLPHVTNIKWETELNINKKKWVNIFYNSFKIRDTKIRAFQYKLILNLIPCNLYLYRISKIDSYKCNFCVNIDHISHYFYECEDTKTFWIQIQNWWNRIFEDNIKLDKTSALFGILKKSKMADRLNAILQLARWHIYTAKLNAKNPFLYKFLIQLKYKLKVEKLIYLRNNKLAKYENMWEDIEDYLD
jgi:hypothetical protein